MFGNFLLVLIIVLWSWMCMRNYRLAQEVRCQAKKLDKYDDVITSYERFQTGTKENNYYIKYGGQDAVTAVVDDIAINATTDEQLKPFFAVLGQPGHNSGETLKAILDLQLSSLLGAGWPYPGRAFTRGVTPMARNMRDSHRGLNVTDEIFTRFVNVAIVPALKKNGVPDADIKALAPALEAMRGDITGRRSSHC